MLKIGHVDWAVDIFDNDIKIDQLVCNKGWTGFSIYYYLCMKAYGTCGYFYQWNQEYSTMIARKMGGGINSNVVMDTVEYCLHIGLFDRKMYQKHRILTSVEIQHRYRKQAGDSMGVHMKPEYCLLDDRDDMPEAKIDFVDKEIELPDRELQFVDKEIELPDPKLQFEDHEIQLPAVQDEGSKAPSDHCENRLLIQDFLNEETCKIESSKGKISTLEKAQGMPISNFELQCVDWLIECIQKDFPGQRVPRTCKEKEKWAVHINRMETLDHIAPEDIWNTLIWTTGDSFWRTIVRSTQKFREKFATLYLQSKRKKTTAMCNPFNQFENRQNYDIDALERELSMC